MKRHRSFQAITLLCLAALFCLAGTKTFAAKTLIPRNAVWKYLDDGSDRGTNWVRLDYNDALWSSGPAELGYGDGDETTVVGFGPDSAAKFPTTYFRHAFVVEDPITITNLLIRLLRDDGAIVYLNETEIFRSNMPAGQVTFADFASGTIGGAAEDTFNESNADANLLFVGTNVVAVEIHQATSGSSDISFNLELIGLTPPRTNNIAPAVSITAPPDKTGLASGTDVAITADASDPDGFVTQVEFLLNVTSLAIDTASPYSTTWNNISPGLYNLFAVATDDEGALATSAPVTVLVTNPPPDPNVLVAEESFWKYLDDGSDQGALWREPGFDDSSWDVGQAQLGYGDGDENTVVSFGPQSTAKFITTYYRQAFVVDDIDTLSSNLTVGLLRDDGGVVYLNGREVFRSNMPAGAITSTTTASGTVPSGDESRFFEQDILAGDLVLGTNVVAVEVHQASGTSSDTSFDLRLSISTNFVPDAVLTRNPYLQLLTYNQCMIRWRTDNAVISQVNFGTNLANLNQVATQPGNTVEHEVLLTGLLPNARYYYAVASGTGPLASGPEYHFDTAPPPGNSRLTRIWVLGDSGSANSNARSVRDAYDSFTGSRDTDVMLMLGDNAYENGTEPEVQAGIFDTYDDFLRNTTLWPSLGNHDTGGSTSPSLTLPYFVAFNLPTAGEAGGVGSGTEKYYSYNHGNIHFIALDSQASSRSANGAMANWLRADLAANTLDWVIAYWHHAPYSKGGTSSDSEPQSIEMRSNLVPILEEGGADLVLAGHSHNYERSYLIDGHYGLSGTFQESMKIDGGDGRVSGDGAYFKLGGAGAHQGTVYVVAGSSSRLDSGSLDHPAHAVGVGALGSFVIDINGGRLDGTFVDSAGAIRDTFTIIKEFPPVVTIISDPVDQLVDAGETVTFTVRAVSQNPITYEWFKDGARIPGANGPSITLSNVQEEDDGMYYAVARDTVGMAVSEPARLAILVPPRFVQWPIKLEVVEGETLVLGVESAGTLPMSYRWRFGFTTQTVETRDSHVAFFTITNVSQANAGVYTVVLTNAAFYLPGIISPLATVTVLTDTDGDLMPDDWETENGLNPSDPSDKTLDLDGDGLDSREEYRSGTDPGDPESFLKIDRIALSNGVAIHFQARSNLTYTVEYKDDITLPTWTRLEDVVAGNTNRSVIITDTLGNTDRYYRLTTPRLP